MSVRARRHTTMPLLKREGRVELRTTAAEKQLLSAAAAQERLDVTGFILKAALPAAREVLERANRVQLSARDTARVLELLEHPPEPTALLRDAAAAFLANQQALGKAIPSRRRSPRGRRRA